MNNAPAPTDRIPARHHDGRRKAAILMLALGEEAAAGQVGHGVAFSVGVTHP